jgi:hypothetical protein
MGRELDPKHQSEQDQKDTRTQTHCEDTVAESAYQADSPDNPKKHFRRQTPEHHNELKMRVKNHINVQDDDATAEKS